MSAPECREARGVADLRLWLADQWQPGRIYARTAALVLDGRPGDWRNEGTNPAKYAEWEHQTLQQATLWWVAADMVDLLMAAAEGVPDDVVQYDLPIPAGAGLVVFEKPWWGLDSHTNERRVAVDAMLWGHSRWRPREVRGIADQQQPGVPGTPWYTGLSLSSYRRVDFGQGLADHELQLATATGAVGHANLQPLGTDPADHGTRVLGGQRRAAAATGTSWVPLGRSDWPVLHHLGAQPWQGHDLQPDALASFVEDRKVLAAFWALIHQEGVAARVATMADRPTARRTERAGIPAELAAVQVVTLRRARRAAEPTETHSHVNWSHRWLVQGFWRWQPVGPGRTQRRLTYVRPHIRGSEDKPLHLSTKVHAWTR